MGNRQSREVPKRSPLGCILQHWEDIVGEEGTEEKQRLVKYCSQRWPLYELGNEMKWPIKTYDVFKERGKRG